MPARQAIAGAISRGNRLAISAVTLAEILYLEEKGRFRSGTFAAIRTELQTSGTALEEIPVSGDIVEAMRRVRRELVPDLPDRIIAATSVYLGIPVVSADRQIHSASIPVIW